MRDTTSAQIRLAAAADRHALTEIDPQIVSDPHRRALIENAIAVRLCWVAEQGAQIVGYGVVTRNFFGRNFLELLYVSESARRAGAGSAILDAIEESCTADRLFTSTNQSNAPMRALLTKRNYHPSGRIENLDPGDPELVYIKFLRGP